MKRLKIGLEQFPALTGIRAVAAFMVFFNHLPLWLKPNTFIGLQLCFFYGVTLFFVLSGFLITYKYFDKLRFSRHWLRQYFLNRFARIYPVYFLLLTIVIVLRHESDPVFLFQNYTLLQNLFPLSWSHGSAIGPSWSLTVEECFYIAAPLIMYLTLRVGLWLPAMLFAVLAAITISIHGPLNLHHQFPLLMSSIFGRFPEFLTGVFLALRIRRNDRLGLADISGKKWTISGVILFILLTLPMIYVTNKPETIRLPVMLVVNNLLLPSAIALAYYGLIYEHTWLRLALGSGFAGLLGRSSYAFYLLHWPLIEYLGKPFLEHGYFYGHHNLYVLSMFTLCNLLSTMIFLLYEEPMRRWIRGWGRVHALSHKRL